MKSHSSQYFEDNYEDYVQGWSEDHIHYGFWYEDTKTHEESLLNHTKEMLKHLNIRPGDCVLDAGCGSGGSSRYIVENYGVETTGIMLSQTLLEAAENLSKDTKNRSLLQFFDMDFTDTSFEDESFSKIFAIESVCQAENKSLFIKEAFRLLKTRGRLVVADFFLLRTDLDENDHKIYREWCDGWFIPDLATIDDFRRRLEQQGFMSVQYYDKTPLIRKCGKYMYDGAEQRLPATLMQQSSGKLPPSRLAHVIATYRQWECIENGIWGFGMFNADK